MMERGFAAIDGDRDNSTVYLAGPLDCGGIREVDVHGSKGPL
jgi:hypothetical protein